MNFFKRSNVPGAVKLPSFTDLLVEAHQYIFNDFKRIIRALYPVLILSFVCSVAVTFSENGFSYVGWMYLPWVAAYFYMMMLVFRDIVSGRRSDFVDIINQRHPASKKCFFRLIWISFFSILPFALVTCAVQSSFYLSPPFASNGEAFLGVSFAFVPVVFALLLSAVAARWTLAIPAAYDGVQLTFKDTKRLSKDMPVHILFLGAAFVLYSVIAAILMIQGFSDLVSSATMEMDEAGEVVDVTMAPLIVTPGLFAKAVLSFVWETYYLVITCFLTSRIYQLGSQNLR